MFWNRGRSPSTPDSRKSFSKMMFALKLVHVWRLILHPPPTYPTTAQREKLARSMSRMMPPRKKTPESL